MSSITTHVLDTSTGRPASDIDVALAVLGRDDTWSTLGAAKTDADGRAKNLLPPGTTLSPGTYRLRFDTGSYHTSRGQEPFFPHVEIVFLVRDPTRHHHVPLLLSPFGYSTYRGS